ncbi:MAG TPA: hypothetical protein VGR06_42370 [Actinophytocola sp.]|jgi:hypothetical protein|uniref:hypothetical protein n=1 Tax=Actinophytocola sp. TaxID=1872138 RepID=UPI002E09DA4D|nr:hypothetical protein [Actinophytocola sp.]
MRYPSAEDYVKAVQRLESFTDDDLRRMELVVHPLYQIPMPAAGTSAVVFKAVLDGEAQALRFFTRADTWSAERYPSLHNHFIATGLASSVAMPLWVNDAIRVNGSSWPVVRMQWVEGHTLNKYVEDLIQQKDIRSLSTLAAAWRELVTRLQRAEFAHGDLQHGNILVDSGSEIRLVDFDCSWVARFAGGPAPSETGHRNYQPASRPWGQWMDTFSGLVIYVSLLALSKNPHPWSTLNTGENLLFRHDDFHPPFGTPTWTQLSSIGDRQLDDLVSRLKECCTPGWVASGGLDDLLAPRVKPWWERTQTEVAAAVGAPPRAPEPPRAPLPPPRPERWPEVRPQPNRVPPRPPSPDWWQAVPGGGTRERPGQRPRAKRNIGRVIATALLAGFVVGGLSGAAAGAVGVPVGLIVSILVLIVGLAKRQ